LRLPKPPADDEGAVHLRGLLHSRRRDAAAVGFHYDQPLAFYQAFLDPNLVYSCGYFDDGVTTLEQAQLAKIDYILRKVRLAPGERLLDVGFGWGALAIRAAERFGADVVGVTLSRGQYDEGRRRVAQRGLEGRVSIELRDYRDVRAQSFDKIVSVGMVEHVGHSHLAEYFAAAFTALRDGGFFLNQGIAEESPGRAGGRSTGFIDRYVFPDSDLVAISDVVVFAERAGFEVRDVENLREHYARTLRAWVANLEHNAQAAQEAPDARTIRIWRLYMAGSAQGFASGRMGLFQSLLAKPGAGGSVALPPTRRDLYRP
jgi:cyclopropane-fatty-acyl-phospholipid synthase